MKFDIDDLTWDAPPTTLTQDQLGALHSSGPTHVSGSFPFVHANHHLLGAASAGPFASHSLHVSGRFAQPNLGNGHADDAGPPTMSGTAAFMNGHHLLSGAPHFGGLASIAEHSRLATSAPTSAFMTGGGANGVAGAGVGPIMEVDAEEGTASQSDSPDGSASSTHEDGKPVTTSSAKANGNHKASRQAKADRDPTSTSEAGGGDEGDATGLVATGDKPEKKKPHLCEICGVGFARKVHLQRHSLRHNTCRPYSCEQCGKCFSRQDSLVRHHRLLHERDGARNRGAKSRERAAQVCTRCSQFKLRCDGGAPCSACVESGVGASDCIMPPKVSKRSRSNSSMGTESLFDEEDVLGSDAESRPPLSARSFSAFMEAEESAGSTAADDRHSLYSASYSSSAFSPSSLKSPSALLASMGLGQDHAHLQAHQGQAGAPPFDSINGHAGGQQHLNHHQHQEGQEHQQQHRQHQHSFSIGHESHLDAGMLQAHGALPSMPLFIQTGFFGEVAMPNHPHSAHPALGASQPAQGQENNGPTSPQMMQSQQHHPAFPHIDGSNGTMPPSSTFGGAADHMAFSAPGQNRLRRPPQQHQHHHGGAGGHYLSQSLSGVDSSSYNASGAATPLQSQPQVRALDFAVPAPSMDALDGSAPGAAGVKAEEELMPFDWEQLLSGAATASGNSQPPPPPQPQPQQQQQPPQKRGSSANPTSSSPSSSPAQPQPPPSAPHHQLHEDASQMHGHAQTGDGGVGSGSGESGGKAGGDVPAHSFIDAVTLRHLEQSGVLLPPQAEGRGEEGHAEP